MVLLSILIVADAGQDKIVPVRLQGLGVVFLLNLGDCTLGTVLVFKLQQERWAVSARVRQKHQIGKAFTRGQFADDSVVISCAVEGQRQGTGEGVLIVIGEQRASLLVGTGHTLGHGPFITHKQGLQQSL